MKARRCANTWGSTKSSDAAQVPPASRVAACADPARALKACTSGGDDYELAFTAAPEKRPALAALAARLDLPLWRIGWTRALHDTPPGVTVLDADGQPLSLNHTGFDHFAQKT